MDLWKYLFYGILLSNTDLIDESNDILNGFNKKKTKYLVWKIFFFLINSFNILYAHSPHKRCLQIEKSIDFAINIVRRGVGQTGRRTRGRSRRFSRQDRSCGSPTGCNCCHLGGVLWHFDAGLLESVCVIVAQRDLRWMGGGGAVTGGNRKQVLVLMFMDFGW